MKVKIIVHIGVQRTGTTFFQHEVFPKLNIRYISPTFFRYGDIGTLAEFYKYILKEDTLVSNENIYCDMWSKKDVRFERLEILHKLFPFAKIILGIRSKESLINSWYKKSIASGAVWNYKEFLHQINMNFFEYGPYIEKLKELFEDVYIYRYEDFRKKPYEIIEEMCNFMDVEIPEIGKEAYGRKWNIGYTTQQIKVARILNKMFKTRLNPKGIIPLKYSLHPHRLMFQKDLFFKLQGKRTKLLPVYPAER